MHLRSVAISTVAFLGIAITEANAIVVTGSIPFNEALTFSYNPNASGIGAQPPCCDYLNTIVTAPLSPATQTYSETGPWGSVSAYAQADLATGTLKIQASAADSGSGAFPSIQSNAIFGDSFTTTQGGTPFTWNGSTATFNMALTGANSLTSSDNFATSGGFIVLAILPKGTLDPNKPLIGQPGGQYFEYNIGNPTFQIYYTDPSGNSTPLAITAGYTTIPSEISTTFAPGGDFDWALLLGASGQEGVGQSFDVDLSHTLTLDYVAPEGTTTVSDSGLFDNISDETEVPEPLTLSLFGAGLAGAVAMRRRKSKS
jgi:PEP-CTERM motif